MRSPRATWPLVLSLALGACAPIYTGTSSMLRPESLRTERGWTAVSDVPYVRQHSEHDCGAAALDMVMAYWRAQSVERAGAERTATRSGEARTAELGAQRASVAELREHARALGYQSFAVEGTLNDVAHELGEGRPVIAGLAKPTTQGALGHYEVVIGLHVRRRRVATLDPALGPREYAFEDFLREWIGAGRPLLVVLGPERQLERLDRGTASLVHAHERDQQ